MRSVQIYGSKTSIIGSNFDAKPANSRGAPYIMPDEPMKPRVRPEGRHYYDLNRIGSGISSVFQWNIAEHNGSPLPLDTAARKRHKSKNFVIINKEEVKDIENKMRNMDIGRREKLLGELSKPLWKSEKLEHPSQHVQNGHQPNHTRENATKRSRSGRSARRKMVTDGQVHNNMANVGSEKISALPRSKSVEPLAIDMESAEKHRDFGPKTPRESSQINKPAHDASVQTQNPMHVKNQVKIERPNSSHGLSKKEQGHQAPKIHPAGHIPRYLKDKKEKQKKAAAIGYDGQALPGHVLMAEDEKQKTLASLKRAESDLVRRFNSLPVRTDTTFLKRKKQQLLRQLEEVDEAVQIFSRAKVYMKVD